MSIIDLIKTTTPRYETFLPSTGEKTFFRPFNVKEQKHLLLAEQEEKESVILKSICEIVEKCVDEVETASMLSVSDLEYLFCKVRAKSVSEVIHPTFTCPHTNEQVKIEVDLNDIEVKSSTDSGKKTIQVNDSLSLTLRNPIVLDYIILGDDATTDQLAAFCIENIKTSDEVFEGSEISKEEKIEIIENLTAKTYEKIEQFIKDQPRVTSECQYRTSDGKIREINVSGFKDFFV
jgi:predicted Fe-S protein YdhL (DUF1289 family)